MILKDKDNTPELYADLYSKYKITGTPYLAYRDLPLLLKQYVVGTNALDYGCGSGESTLFLKANGYDVTSIDINEKMLSIAKSRDISGNYIKIKSGNIPFEDNSFDLVFCSFVLLEISSQEKIIEIVKDIKRVLKKDGIFISIGGSDFTYDHEWLSLNTNFPENKNIDTGSQVKIEFKDFNLTIYDYFWKQADYIQMFTNAGLNVMKVHNPLGKDDDGYNWIDEKEFSPSSVFICKKES